ncbi:MAG TPA: Ppx/GppA phosphatase family protein [Phycisphaerae bacterium]|nr:Ppx/GppA phosphatase family protein [Phycisphaerae bacterium]
MAEEAVNLAAGTVAVVDIGSNAIRMTIADVAADGRIEVLERTHRAVHLGQDTFVTGRISTRAIHAALGVLGDFRRMLDTYQVRRIRTVATSAVREASNADAFQDRVYISCGLDVEVISTSEESRLKISAVREAAASVPGIDIRDALVVEVGGGSALLTILQAGQIVASESYALGSIRLQEALSIRDEAPERAADLIRHQIAGVMAGITTTLPMKKVKTFVAVGGDVRFASHQIGRPTGSPQLSLIKRKKFDRLVERCQGLIPERLTRQYDLSHGEAETLVPALLVYQALIHETAAKEIIASDTSMRDGLLLDLARNVTGHEDEELTEGVIQSARAICEKYRCDAAHSAHVTELAIRLFDELREQHRLSGRHRLLLRVAAMLHEAGVYVSGRAHHKHSYYLISNAEVFGLNAEEVEVVALVARYHRRGAPKPSHVEYISLPREKRMVVSKLAAILRVADALDRGHAQQVRDVHLERTSDELVITVHGAADLALERRAMEKKADLFEDICGMTVRLEEAPLAPAET